MSEDITVVRDEDCAVYSMAPLIARPNMTVDELPSTLPRDRDGITRRWNALGQSTLELDRDGTLLMEVQDVIAHWVADHEGDDGELSSYSWVTLIDPAGERWGTSSPVVAQKIGWLVALWLAGKVERPTTVQIVTRTAVRSRQRYHDVIMV